MKEGKLEPRAANFQTLSSNYSATVPLTLLYAIFRGMLKFPDCKGIKDQLCMSSLRSTPTPTVC